MMWIVVIIKEFFFLLRTIIESFRSFFPLEWKKKKGKTPILLVHGYMNFASVWLYVGPRLFKKDLGSIYTLTLKHPLGSIEEFAEQVNKKALQIAKKEKTKDLILIGHSMGGLVSLYYAMHLASPGSVQKLITIGSPLKGTKAAVIGIGKCAKQMKRGSSFIKKLNLEYNKHKDVLLYHIGTKKDQLIIPYASSFLADKCYLVDNMGHIELIYSKKILDKIVYWIA